MIRNKVNKSFNDKNVIALFFDANKISEYFYGNTIFEKIIESDELSENAYKMIFSIGDIIDKDIYDDLNPFVIRDELCTIDQNEIYHGNIFVVLIEDIETYIVQKIDVRLKSTFAAYIGMSTVDINSTDTRKQFWKSLIRSFSIEGKNIISFGSREEDVFVYEQAAVNRDYSVNYDGFPFDYSCNKYDDVFSTRQSSFIRFGKQLQVVNGKNDSDRGILEMNFSLVKEVELAGVQIWKAIEDINRVYIDRNWTGITDYLFTSLYQASQGIERLLKIIIELIEYKSSEASDKLKIDELLYSHKHSAMYDFISKTMNISLNGNCRKMLIVLDSFYSSARYHRFVHNDCNTLELKLLLDFGANINNDNFDENLKNLYGKALGQISQALYKVIHELSQELNIYVYELNWESTANFVLNSYYGNNLYKTLKQIEQSKKEFLWYIMNNCEEQTKKQILDEITPLKFEVCNADEFISELISNKNGCHDLYDFVSNEYDKLIEKDKLKWKERVDAIGVIGNTNIILDEGM